MERKSMKKYLMTGLVILMPVVLTGIIIAFLFHLLTDPFIHILGDLFRVVETIFHLKLSPQSALFISRLLIVIALFIFIVLLGVVARWFLIKNIFSLTNTLMTKIPIVNTIYKLIREIISALFAIDGKKAFHSPVLIPFPQEPTYSLGFHSGEVAKECQMKVNTPLISVFTPTSPHPISGFLFLCPEKEAHKIDMTNEEALKFLVSCGLVYKHEENVGVKSKDGLF
jgi:uncharacterized membrane protein